MRSYQVDRQRWAQLTLIQQLGNIGSEVGRSVAARRRHDSGRFEGALERALDLFEATIDILIAQKSPRVREVLVAKDQYLNLFFGYAPVGDEEKIEQYFMNYAIAARRNV
jgi:hypothetical protein